MTNPGVEPDSDSHPAARRQSTPHQSGALAQIAEGMSNKEERKMATARNYYVDKKEILELKYKMSEYEDKETELNPFGFDGGEPDSFYDGMRQYNDHVSSIIKRLKTELVENYTTDGETCDPEAGEKYFTELKENVPTLVNGSLVQSLTPNEWQSLVKEIGRYAWKVTEKNLRMASLKSHGREAAAAVARHSVRVADSVFPL